MVRLSIYKFWIKLLIVLLVLYFTPLLGYVWRLGEAVVEHGFSHQTLVVMARHTDWFKRYFTGPPSDDEMIAFFHKQRADLERAAYLYAHNGYCHHNDALPYRQECEQLQERTGTRVGLGTASVHNSIYRDPKYTCGPGCNVQEHYFFDVEEQDWWRSWNTKIKAWRKSLEYVPPLLPAEYFGLDPKDYPNDPVKVMRRHCHPRDSLDSVPSEIEKESLLDYECAVRHIEDQWFIVLRPVVKN